MREGGKGKTKFQMSRNDISLPHAASTANSQFNFHLPTFKRQHRRNSSHPNFSFHKNINRNNHDDDKNNKNSHENSKNTHTNNNNNNTSNTGKNADSAGLHLHQKITSFIQELGGASTARRRQHHLDSLPRLQAAKVERSTDPGDLLHMYQFLSLGCCAKIQSCPRVRRVLAEKPHNSEATNYKLSYLRESM